jgi:hypothetical protein
VQAQICEKQALGPGCSNAAAVSVPGSDFLKFTLYVSELLLDATQQRAFGRAFS